MSTLRSLIRRLDAIALDQLRETAAAQSRQIEALQAEIEALRVNWARAEDDAEAWRQDAMTALEAAAHHARGQIALHRDGHMTLIHPAGAA